MSYFENSLSKYTTQADLGLQPTRNYFPLSSKKILVNPLSMPDSSGRGEMGTYRFTPFRTSSERRRRKGQSPRPLGERRGRNSPPVPSLAGNGSLREHRSEGQWGSQAEIEISQMFKNLRVFSLFNSEDSSMESSQTIGQSMRVFLG